MSVKIGIVGATGIVGTELIALLEERNIQIAELRLFASEKSEGKKVSFREKLISVENIKKERLTSLDYLFFCSTNEISREFVPFAAENGVCCIDNSSAFREKENVPLVVPEINPFALKSNKNIIANPNCSTIIALMALFPLHARFHLRGFCAATYQAVSGVGYGGINALENDYKGDIALSKSIFGEQISFNAIPKIGDFSENCYTSEELKMLNESKKILALPKLAVSATCVRIPVVRAHSISIIAQFDDPIDLSSAEKALSEYQHIDFFRWNGFPSAIRQTSKNNVGVGRLRIDTFLENALSMWVVGDQIRKGAALNALQIMELLESNK